ncbi:tetraspanin-33-like [Ornithodoros turicata]|uniref:tetraspanin-33-like n=1 Tax=Ornithodoros turicata TaxID=34597 RepID=UPI00313A2879
MRTTTMMTAAEPPPMIDVNPLLRYPLIIVNLLLMIVAGGDVTISGYSLYLRWDEIHFLSVLMTIVVNLEIPFLIIGIIVFTVSSLGFIGGLRENVQLLTFYSKTLFVLVVLCLLAMVLAFAIPHLSRKYVDSVVTLDLIVHYRDNDDFMRLIDFMQYYYRCCGVTDSGYHDWNHNIYFNCTHTNPSYERCSVPASCCCHGDEDMVTVLSNRFCGWDALKITEQEAWKKIYTRSCTNIILAQVKSYSVYITLGCCVVMMFFLAMRYLAMNVQDQIVSLTAFYEKYFADIRRGEERKSIIRLQALQSIPKGCVEVGSKKAAPRRIEPVSKVPVLVNGPAYPAIPTDSRQSPAIPTPSHFRMG